MNWKILLLATFAISGLQEDPPATSNLKNNPPAASKTSSSRPAQMCPIMPDQEIDPDIFVDYKGTRVYFCCPRCRNKFKRDPETYFKLINLASETVPASANRSIAPTTRPAASPASPAASPSSMWVNRVGRLHPAMTDLPIGVLMAAAVAEFLNMRRRQPLYDSAARFCVWFAALTGIVTAPLGWCLAGYTPGTDDWLLATHRWMGTASLLFLLVILWTSEHARRTNPESFALWSRYRLLLFAGTLFVAATAFFGGAMVWGIDHYWN